MFGARLIPPIRFDWCLSLITASAVLAAEAAPLEIQNLVTFADAHQVRIQAALKATEKLAAVELAATIIDTKTGAILWQGSLGETNLASGGVARISRTVQDLRPKLWSPASPALYTLQFVASHRGQKWGEARVRFGFRSFESRNGQFYLNGRPIFLRGLAINPPGRTIPVEVGESREFAEAYVRFLKSRNVNTIRMTHDSQVWFEVCDELGMIVYQGQYGAPLGSEPGRQRPPSDLQKSIAAYEELFTTYAPHPSILIYILANEMPISGVRGRAYHEFFTAAHGALRAWDPTRLFIGNAGYGEGREGDICDVHRYWGWYYNTFLTYYNLRNPALFGDATKNQPITFSECVGCFTGPSGEFNLIVRKQLGAQLNWTGHSANQREDALAYQSFMVKQAIESFRRLREVNPRLGGLMPFTILFDNWSGIKSFDEMRAKPALEQMAVSYQPILLSWELWTPQVYAGATIHPVAHIINDADDGRPLTNATVVADLQAPDGSAAMHVEIPMPDLAYFGTWSKKLEMTVPAGLATGRYCLKGKVLSGGRTVSENQEELFIADSAWENERPQLDKALSVYDPAGQTAAALRRWQIPFKRLEALSPAPATGDVLILGEAAPVGSAAAAGLKSFIAQGGHILCLQPNPTNFDSTWLPEPVEFCAASAHAPTYPPASRPFSGDMNINPERPEHPVFKGLDRARLAMWSDYTGWDEGQPGFPKVYPVTTGFKLKSAESLAHTAVLANYDRGLEGIGLAEMFAGSGSVMLCGFELVPRLGLDPAAERFLRNLLGYEASAGEHGVYPRIEKPILWGNYAEEQGAIAGPLNGLVVNAEWVRPPTNPHAVPLSQAEGAWNTRPGDQFVAHGRSLLGPYGYSTGSSLKDLDPDSEAASGCFWAQIPPGKTRMTTTLLNPAKRTANFSISVNDGAPEQKSIPAGQTQVRTELPGGATNLCVRFHGAKSLVLLQTAFE